LVMFARVSGGASGVPVSSLPCVAGKVASGAFASAFVAAHEPRDIREGELRYTVS
jgi:hypothetical protein